MAGLNWAKAGANRLMRERGTESIQGAATPARKYATARPRSTESKAEPTQLVLAEVDKFWRDRSGRAVIVRLTEYSGYPLVDIRTFFAADGKLLPGKGFTCGVRLLPQLARAIAKATAEAQRLGLLPAEGTHHD